MPLYDFECTATDCDEQLEALVKSDVLFQTCPKCSSQMKRLIPHHTDSIRPLKEKNHRDLPSGTKPRYHRYNVE